MYFIYIVFSLYIFHIILFIALDNTKMHIMNNNNNGTIMSPIIYIINSYFFARSSSRIAGIKPLRNAISKTPSASFVPGYCCIAHLMYM